MSEEAIHTEEALPAPGTGLEGFRAFADLVLRIGSSTKTTEKLNALVQYFYGAPDKDKVWMIAIFSGRRPKRVVNTTQLATWAVEMINLPFWLFEESYHTVGDLAETIALLLPESDRQPEHPEPLHYYIEQLKGLDKQSEEARKYFILESWQEMSFAERFVFNKLITGGFRIGVSQKLMVNALAKTVKTDPAVIAHRISGNWDPATISFDELLSEEAGTADASKPYPFYLAYAIEEPELEKLGDPREWQAEWKWDGIRGQLIKRRGELFVWSRGEELMTEKFPEYASLLPLLPEGVVLDGEIIPSQDGKPLPFALLQTRIGRKNVTKKQLQEAPISFFAYDLLEWEGEDWRTRPLSERRARLEEVVRGINHPILLLSEIVAYSSWQELAELRRGSREMGAEGFMLKRRSSTYQVGRKRGDWWKWKIDPLTIDAVMIYAQKGAGRRSNLYTDYTFAVRDGDKLVPFTKAYSGLTDKEFAQVDAFVKKNSLEKFGPVRTVKPELVFEIAFEGIAASNRHKSGVALRFPRISRWRHDKKADEINTLEELKQLLEVYGK
ncbi:ATP-dependent DNA ligase [Flaviaesturariibacter flavus]|uniref:DNA ligase (ATP) n=1 Tax=Flaviaesturariibacter flavus TaxID=2502780 RepID=A0A4R1BKL6_9BACT|nr:ATP-dependent DNA ligase [Flaviaesturariibacter flavus]TCJ17768.1 ATP-dependent DNA ligase [Flaviaesturariibacter flavus]